MNRGLPIGDKLRGDRTTQAARGEKINKLRGGLYNKLSVDDGRWVWATYHESQRIAEYKQAQT